ncbi:hypothetical protein ACHAXM_011092 [Skeletonema potamos]
MESVETTSLLPAGSHLHEKKENRYTSSFPTALVGAVAIIVVATFFRGEGDNLFHSRTRAHLPSTISPSFPSDFVWGAATSSFQIEGAASEGGRGASIWDTFCKESEEHCNGDTGDVTDDHYHRWRQDVQLMKSLGLKAYRFSISWSRILPMGVVDFKTGDDDTNIQGVNYEGVQFYNKLINELLESNIVPFVTLYHWDLPQNLQDRYRGWEDLKIIDDFANYARVCFHFFGDRVKHWITINEGWTVAIHGYEEASNAPGLLGKDIGGMGDPYLVGHHLLLAHATAVAVFREEGYYNDGKSVIGISNSGDFRFPLNSESVDDQEAATRSIEFQLGWFTDPLYVGDYPKSMRDILGDRLPKFSSDEMKLITGSADFLGLNHYSSAMASKPAKSSQWGGYWADQFVTLSDDRSWEKTAMGWNIAPEGAKGILLWIANRYNSPNIYVTENGVACHGTNFEQSIHDTERIEYLAGYIKGFGEAIAEGVKLKGYFAWSLFDNFEWQYGLSKRFGIVYVNYTSLERTPKDSAKWYKAVIESNGNKLFSNPS